MQNVPGDLSTDIGDKLDEHSESDNGITKYAGGERVGNE